MVGGTGWRLALAGLAAAGAVAAGGCGEQPSDAEQIESVVLEMQDAYRDGDFKRLCESVTRKAWEEVGRTAHEHPWLCRKDLARAGEYIERDRAKGYAHMPTVAAVDVNGDRATVTADFGHAAPHEVEFAKRDGEWKLHNFFGVAADATRPAKAPPVRPEERVVVARTDGERCGDVRPAGPRVQGHLTTLRGGCRLAVTHDGPIDFHVRTLFGAYRFPRCEMEMTLRVDDRGRVWIDELNTLGAIACNDIELCKAHFGHWPWVGRIDADMRVRINACFGTCIGSFRDQLVLDLERDASRWRLVARDEVVGAGGWEVDGRWKLLASSDLEIQPG